MNLRDEMIDEMLAAFDRVMERWIPRLCRVGIVLALVVIIIPGVAMICGR